MKRDSLKRNIFFSLVLLTSACALPTFKLHAGHAEFEPTITEEVYSGCDGFDAEDRAFIESTYERIKVIAAEVKGIHEQIDKPSGWGISKIIQFLDKKIKEINDTILVPLKEKANLAAQRNAAPQIQKALSLTSDIAEELQAMLKELHSIATANKSKGSLVMATKLKLFLSNTSKLTIPHLDKKLNELHGYLKAIPNTCDLQEGMEIIITKLRELKKELDKPTDTMKAISMIKMVLDRR